MYDRWIINETESLVARGKSLVLCQAGDHLGLPGVSLQAQEGIRSRL